MNQPNLFANPWGLNSGFSRVVDELNALIPISGKCEFPKSKNKNLEKFRNAQNAAYDFFNNGLCNRRPLFVRIFGPAPRQKDFRYFSKVSWEQWEDIIERKLTPMIIAAAREQGVK